MQIDTSLVGKYGFYYSGDPAWNSGGVDEETGVPDEQRVKFLAAWTDATVTGDYAAVPQREGLSPIRWTLQHIGSRQVRAILQEVEAFNAGKAPEQMSTPWIAMYRAARLGLVAVEGLRIGEDEFVVEVGRDPDLKAECATHKSMDIISRITNGENRQIGNSIINEIGNQVVGGGSPAGKS